MAPPEQPTRPVTGHGAGDGCPAAARLAVMARPESSQRVAPGRGQDGQQAEESEFRQAFEGSFHPFPLECDPTH